MLNEDALVGATALEHQAIEQILVDLGLELSRRRSRLAHQGAVDGPLELQTRGILAETFAQIRELAVSPDSLVTIEYGTSESMVETAHVRAAQGVHPAEPLMAAEALFGIALPLVVETSSVQLGSTDPIAVARTLHHAVWRRFPPGAISYVEFLRTRLSHANQESRRRIALELHDRIAHGIAAGIQRVELAMMGAESEAAQQVKLAAAVQIFRTSLADVQDLALELRQRVGERLIDAAISDYLADTTEMSPPSRLTVRGEPVRLQASIAEEVFTIVLEAIRNARNHANDASIIDVNVIWRPDDLAIEVADDGPGFDPSAVHARAIGLVGMQERAEAVGARIEISASPSGTKVLVELPINLTVTP